MGETTAKDGAATDNETEQKLDCSIEMTERGPEEKLDKLRQLMLQENTVEEGVEDSGQIIPSEEFCQLLASLTPAQVSTTVLSGRLMMTLLQETAYQGKEKHLQQLLNHGVDHMSPVLGRTPFQLAIRGGHLGVIKVFTELVALDWKLAHHSSKRTVLHDLFRKSDKKSREGRRSVLDWLMEEREEVQEQLATIVNDKDIVHETALSLAAQGDWGDGKVAWLLGMGGDITALPPNLAEGFLDRCISHEGKIGKDNLKITLHYKWQDKGELPGIPWVSTMCESPRKGYSHILKHPVVSAFLWRKWQSVAVDVQKNLCSGVLFTTALTWFIFHIYGSNSNMGGNETNTTKSSSSIGKMSDKEFCFVNWNFKMVDEDAKFASPNWYWYYINIGIYLMLVFLALSRCCSAKLTNLSIMGVVSSFEDFLLPILSFFLLLFGSSGLPTFLAVLTLWLLVQEFLQLLTQRLSYFHNEENVYDIIVLTFNIVLLFFSRTIDCGMLRLVAVLVLLLAWARLLSLSVKHPTFAKFDHYLPMFFKVLKTFVPAMVFFFVLLMAFGFAFYILLHQDGNEDFVFFNSPFLAIMKTLTMFIGELDFADIPNTDTDDLSHFPTFGIIIIFMFTMMVILMNLLNGLAVADVGELLQEAETMSIKARVKTIALLEERDFASMRLFSKAESLICCKKKAVSTTEERLTKDQVEFSEEGGGRIHHLLGTIVRTWLCGPNRVDIPDDIKNNARLIVLRMEEEAARVRDDEKKETLEKEEKRDNTNKIQRIEENVESMRAQLKELKELLQFQQKAGE